MAVPAKTPMVSRLLAEPAKSPHDRCFRTREISRPCIKPAFGLLAVWVIGMGAALPQAPTPGPSPTRMTRPTGPATAPPDATATATAAAAAPAGAAANADRAESSGRLVRAAAVPRAGRPADRPGQRPASGRRANPDIAIARQQVLQAVADLEQARALWLPSLFIGPTYYRADGQVQTINGQVETVNRELAVPGHDGRAGQRLPRPVAGNRLPAAERPELGPADLRRDLRAHGGQAGRRRAAGRAPGHDQRHAAGGLRSLFRPPAGRRRRWPSPARPPANAEALSSITARLRPDRPGPGGRPPPRPDRVPPPPPGDPGRERAVEGRLGQPDPPAACSTRKWWSPRSSRPSRSFASSPTTSRSTP